MEGAESRPSVPWRPAWSHPQSAFRKCASWIACAVGSPAALAIAGLLVGAWAFTGPYFDFSSSWQLVINTGTTIVTFLMAFVIHATQQRESKTLHVKLDELLRALEGARTGLAALDSLSDEDLDAVEKELVRLGRAEGIASVRDIRARARARGIGQELASVVGSPPPTTRSAYRS